MLCFHCTQTRMKLQSEFSREFLKTIFARLPPLASVARGGPHPPRTPLATPLDDDTPCTSLIATLITRCCVCVCVCVCVWFAAVISLSTQSTTTHRRRYFLIITIHQSSSGSGCRCCCCRRCCNSRASIVTSFRSSVSGMPSRTLDLCLGFFAIFRVLLFLPALLIYWQGGSRSCTFSTRHTFGTVRDKMKRILPKCF